MRKYNYFDYHLPEHDADYYASKAVAILRELKEKFPKQYEESFRCPSEVLTISGVRAFDTYYTLGSDISRELMVKIKQYFVSKGILLMNAAFPYAGENNEENIFSLLHLDAFENLQKSYSYIPGQTPFLHEYMTSDQDFYVWWSLWKDNVAMEIGQGRSKLEFDDSKDTLSWWTPHNITFGMLLGYPGEAISSCYWSDRLGEGYKLQQSNIKHMDKFDGAHIIYDFSPEVADNPNVVSHQQLWSGILDKTYAKLGLLN